uniref:Uncharacterized protein n=1 Tax=Caenorhabditis japonica TaxID=281687 RepID=A0A8R1HJK2_CAEJA
MFSEHKKRQEEAKKKEKNGELIFDDLEAKTRALKLDSKTDHSDLMDGKAPKRKSIKKADQKASTMSLNISKVGGKESTSSQRSNSLESPGINVAKGAKVGLSMFEAATMMCNIVDITTDSTTKSAKNDKTKMLKSKESKMSLGGCASGPFAQMKEAQEQKRKSKPSFDDDDEDS